MLGIFAVVFFFLFKFGILSSFSTGLQKVSAPLWRSKVAVEGSLDQTFISKSELFRENEKLKNENDSFRTQMLNYQTVLDENNLLKEAYGRKQVGEQILAAILVKPGQTLYDTLIVDVGLADNIIVGQKVFANGNILIGEVSEVNAKVSKVKLYSSSGEKLSVIITGTDITTEATGRGGGNFEMTFPRDVEIPKGTEITVPGITPLLVGLVDEVISDPRDPLQKVLLRSPVNVQELKFVQIER